MPATTKGRPAATGRPFQTQSRGNGSQIDAPPKEHNMNENQSTPFEVGDLVLLRYEGGRPQFAAVAYLTDDETFPYIVRTETGPLVVTADEVRTVHVGEDG